MSSAVDCCTGIVDLLDSIGDVSVGNVQVTHDISQLTCADCLRAPGVQTPVIVRFSTVIHERGSPETLRDPRGFAVSIILDASSQANAVLKLWLWLVAG